MIYWSARYTPHRAGVAGNVGCAPTPFHFLLPTMTTANMLLLPCTLDTPLPYTLPATTSRRPLPRLPTTTEPLIATADSLFESSTIYTCTDPANTLSTPPPASATRPTLRLISDVPSPPRRHSSRFRRPISVFANATQVDEDVNV